jgi:uncharacterized protein YrrD
MFRGLFAAGGKLVDLTASSKLSPAKTAMKIRKGLATMKCGRGVPAKRAFEKIRKKYKIPYNK